MRIKSGEQTMSLTRIDHILDGMTISNSFHINVHAAKHKVMKDQLISRENHVRTFYQ